MKKDALERQLDFFNTYPIPGDGPAIREGDSIRAVRKFALDPHLPDWSATMPSVISAHNISSDYWAKPRDRLAVTILSAGESGLLIEDSPMVGVYGLDRLVKELRRSFANSAANGHINAKVVGAKPISGDRKIALMLESDRLVQEREQLADALGRIMGVDTDISTGKPHLTVADFHYPDRGAANKLATQVERIAPAAVMLRPLKINKVQVGSHEIE